MPAVKGHPGHAAVAVDPDHLALDASVQLAAPHVLGEEGIQFGQQAHRTLRICTLTCAGQVTSRSAVGCSARRTRARRLFAPWRVAGWLTTFHSPSASVKRSPI